MNNWGKIIVGFVFLGFVALGYYFNPQRHWLLELQSEVGKMKLEIAEMRKNSPTFAGGAVPLPPANREEGNPSK